MQDPDLTLYFFYTSFYSQKAWTALEEKGFPYKKQLVMLGTGEIHEPWYMRINPNGSVPALKHGERIITDSQDIIHYLDDTFPDSPQLIPPKSSPEYRSKVIHCQQRLDSIRIDMLTFGSMKNPHLTKNAKIPGWLSRRLGGGAKKKLGGEALVNKFKAYAAANPDLQEAYDGKIQQARERSQADGLGGGMPSQVVEKHLEHARQVLQELEDLMEQNNKAGHRDYWVCGPDYTMVDMILGITLFRLTSCGFAYLWEDGKMPNVENIYKRISQRPSFRETSLKSAGPSILLLYVLGHKAKYIKAGITVVGAGLLAAAGLAAYNYLKPIQLEDVYAWFFTKV